VHDFVRKISIFFLSYGQLHVRSSIKIWAFIRSRDSDAVGV